MTDSHRQKPTAGFWITVALVVVLVLYPLSIGPAEWTRSHGWLSPRAMEALRWFYSPLAWLEVNGPEPIRHVLFWYEQLWSG